MTAAGERFYGPHNTTPCRDCGKPADATIGNHFGCCRDQLPIAVKTKRRTGPEIVRAHAETHQFFTIDDLRDAMEREAIAPSRRGRAFAAACEKGWIEQVGHERGGQARYRSCVGPWAQELAEAR